VTECEEGGGEKPGLRIDPSAGGWGKNLVCFAQSSSSHNRKVKTEQPGTDGVVQALVEGGLVITHSDVPPKIDRIQHQSSNPPGAPLGGTHLEKGYEHSSG